MAATRKLPEPRDACLHVAHRVGDRRLAAVAARSSRTAVVQAQHGDALAGSPESSPLPGPREPLRVLGYATNGVADEVALTMLAHALDGLPIVVEMTNTRLLASELVALVRTQDVSVVCLADLPPSPPSKSRYLVKRLHDALPNVNPRRAVGSAGAGGREHADPEGRWRPLVATTLAETRTYLSGLVEIPRIPAPQADGHQQALT